jgi:transcriptional regulator with XRE-family HTH domain
MASDSPGLLMKRTRKLLAEHDKTYPEIAAETGISIYWLLKFGSGNVRNPSVNRVEHLYEYLSGERLVK